MDEAAKADEAVKAVRETTMVSRPSPMARLVPGLQREPAEAEKSAKGKEPEDPPR